MADSDRVVAAANLDCDVASDRDGARLSDASPAIHDELLDASLGPLRGPKVLTIYQTSLDVLLPSRLNVIRGESFERGAGGAESSTKSSLTQGLGYHLSNEGDISDSRLLRARWG